MSDEAAARASALRNTLDSYFKAIAARDPSRLALVFAEDGEIEDPVGTPVRKGRDTLAELFASGMAQASDVEINVLAAFPSGNYIAAHWTTTVRTKAGQQAKAEGIDVLEVNEQGLIVRAEGYWNAAAFREALA
jgi:steroid Delta-isomerase